MRDCALNSFVRQRKLPRPTALAGEMIACAMALFRESYRWERPIRSMGVSVSDLRPEKGDEQLCMFPDTGRARRYELEGAVEDIRRRFGHASILRASLIADGEIGAINPGAHFKNSPDCNFGIFPAISASESLDLAR